MHPPRIATLSLHPPHKSTRATSTLRTRHTRCLSTHTTWKRPQPQAQYLAQKLQQAHCQPRHSRPSILHFSTTNAAKAQEPNFYETLELPPTATAQEIKKQFYTLSMRHHPDRNRKDPKAHHKFTRISTAYNTLRNAQKRAAYDRDHGLNMTQQPSYPSGSHSSHSAGNGSFAGSRPASGLSKRRGTFQGPPPSFYEQGGYGRTGRTGGEGSYSYSGEEFGGKSSGKAEDPEDPMGFIYRNPLGHFNARSHFKTQSAEDRRRIERRRAARRAAVRDPETIARSGGHIDMGMLVSVLGILFGACCIGGLVTRLPRDSMPSGGAAGALDAAEAKRKKDNGIAAS
ncbi:hypothetical protein N7456_001953 [Penicillium angulare]|uniref:J domain-containing protein n=1 Tax=Penicillium angulare TaxID=116970 RepID=A0A9W9G7H4_9EURO|nr:hypothetical protein N7456_001953 [Penicillium angulare]